MISVLGELLARDRRTDEPALLDDANARQYDYRRFCTTAWKVGNFLRHFGVRAGASVAIAAERRPEPVLSVLGTALLGGVGSVGTEPTKPRVLIAPTADLETYSCPPETHRIGYGDQPDDPSDAFFERDVWRENPTKPPARVTPDTPVLRTEDTAYTHRAVLRSARSVVDQWDLTTDSVVAVRAPLEQPETIAAGVVAPLVAGATILLPGEDSAGDCAVVTETGAETQLLTVDAIEL